MSILCGDISHDVQWQEKGYTLYKLVFHWYLSIAITSVGQKKHFPTFLRTWYSSSQSKCRSQGNLSYTYFTCNTHKIGPIFPWCSASDILQKFFSQSSIEMWFTNVDSFSWWANNNRIFSLEIASFEFCILVDSVAISSWRDFLHSQQYFGCTFG
jgi:hypothetical protein